MPRALAVSRLFALTLAVGLVCPSSAAAQTTGTLVGTVENSTGAPLARATVYVVSSGGPPSLKSTSSDEKGNFRLIGLPAGEYLIRFMALGYRDEQRRVSVLPRGESQVDASLATLTLGVDDDRVNAPKPAAQTTGTFVGTVENSSGAPLAGATVYVVSSEGPPFLQSTSSDEKGNFRLSGLPAGEYLIRFMALGYRDEQRRVSVLARGESQVDASLATLTLGGDDDTVNAPKPGTMPQSKPLTIVTSDQIGSLPIGDRLPANFVLLFTPGTVPGPNAGQVSISGAPAFTTLFLQNGASATDPVFGTNNGFVIEESSPALVVTARSSNSFGLGGPTVNVVTRSGGNESHGSMDLRFRNEKWDATNPFLRNVTRSGGAGRFGFLGTGTVGGPVIKDRVFFFFAGQAKRETETRVFRTVNTEFEHLLENRRGEGKLTAEFAGNRVTGYFFKGSQEEKGLLPFATSESPSTLIDSDQPRDLFSLDYTRTFSNRIVLEAQYSRANITFQRTGSTNSSIAASPIFTTNFSQHFLNQGRNGLVPETRNNRGFRVGVRYFLDPGPLEGLETGISVEQSSSTRSATNSLSASGYTFSTAVQQDPFVGRIPLWIPGQTFAFRFTQADVQRFESLSKIARWVNIYRKGRLTAEADVAIGTTSAVVNDAEVAKTTTFGPRLGLAFRASDRTVIRGGYSIAYDPLHPNLASGGAYRDAFNVLQYVGQAGVGSGFAPAFNPASYRTLQPIQTSATVTIDPDLSPASWHQWSFGAAHSVTRGFIAADLVARQLRSAPEDFTSGGSVQVSSDGVTAAYDRQLWTTSDAVSREYMALQTQFRYRVSNRFDFGGHYTRQLKNEGNVQMDGPGLSAGFSQLGDYPAMFNEERHSPIRDLTGFQQDRVRLWSLAELSPSSSVRFTLGAVLGAESGFTFPITATVPVTQEQQTRARNAGAVRPPTTQTLFFGGGLTERYQGQSFIDLALTAEFGSGRIRPRARVEVSNVFNWQALVGSDTTVLPQGPTDALSLPTTFVKSPAFGEPRSLDDYQTPRQFRLTIGFTF